MTYKEDLRVQKTKSALSEAFINLLSTRMFDDITVNELCEAAGIRRATFYKHYKDKYDFLTSFTVALRQRFDNSVWCHREYSNTADYYVAYAKRIVGFISEHELAIDNILKSHLFPTIISIILEQNYKDTRDRLQESVDSGLKLPASVEVIASMCAGGVASAVYCWLVSGKKQPPDAIAEEVGAVVRKIIEPCT